MDPEITALAGTAGSTVVALMATDAWQRTRQGLVAVWRRVHPERADAFDTELENSRADLLAARAAGDEPGEGELRARWQGRLRELLVADPGAAEELRRLLAEVSRQGAESGSAVRMEATARGHGRVYQAGRDQHITEG